MFDTSYLLISLVFSSIGLGYFIYGKKQKHTIAYYSGLCLIVLPVSGFRPNLDVYNWNRIDVCTKIYPLLKLQ